MVAVEIKGLLHWVAAASDHTVKLRLIVSKSCNLLWLFSPYVGMYASMVRTSVHEGLYRKTNPAVIEALARWFH